MAKYIFLYKGPATDPGAMTEEARNAEMEKWMAWMGGLGDGLLEAGAPFGASASVRGDGSTADATDLTGYTMVEADDLDAARGMCATHPFLSDGTAAFSVEVFELVDMG